MKIYQGIEIKTLKYAVVKSRKNLSTVSKYWT